MTAIERGVAFMAINASIENQFEFIQHDWANSGTFANLDAEDVDPLVGERKPGARFRLRDDHERPRRIPDLPRFVTLRGGGYFFIPSLSALRALADGTA